MKVIASVRVDLEDPYVFFFYEGGHVTKYNLAKQYEVVCSMMMHRDSKAGNINKGTQAAAELVSMLNYFKLIK